MGLKPSPNKSELARMKVLSDLGNSPGRIGRMVKRDGKTVFKYLRKPEIFEDPEIQNLIEEYKKREIDDLNSIIMKARQRIHQILDEGKISAIPATAIMDRAFNQRRLLEGLSTQNLDTQSVVAYYKGILKDLQEKKEKLFKQIEMEDKPATNIASKGSNGNNLETDRI